MALVIAESSGTKSRNAQNFFSSPVEINKVARAKIDTKKQLSSVEVDNVARATDPISKVVKVTTDTKRQSSSVEVDKAKQSSFIDNVARATDPLLNQMNNEVVYFGQKLQLQVEKPFYTKAKISFGPKILMDNLWDSWQQYDFRRFKYTISALCSLFAFSRQESENSLSPANNTTFKPNPKKNSTEKTWFMPHESSVPREDLTETAWINFQEKIQGFATFAQTLHFYPSFIAGPGFLVEADHPQNNKLWLFENGFISVLQSKTLSDLKGLPLIFFNTVRNLETFFYQTGKPIFFEICSISPEWDNQENESLMYPAEHWIHFTKEVFPLKPITAEEPIFRTNKESRAAGLAFLPKYLKENLNYTVYADGNSMIFTGHQPLMENSQYFHIVKESRYFASQETLELVKQIKNTDEGSQSDLCYTNYFDPMDDTGSDFWASLPEEALANIENMMEG